MGISYANDPKEQELVIDETAVYMVDWSKMTSVNDMILILASMAIGFPGNHPNIQQLKPFLNLDNPIKREQPTHPQISDGGIGKIIKKVQTEVALPKLKTIK
jgi:hypothetical protein